ncbi:LOW QUALITY PROTEIN: protein cueball [Pogonomyrmex barbatus]|uniref:Protein cueball n=1 Tax=Pogonomyrmex barbatus TaxID=144034 RepID=A0A6I9W2X5_9HYME|nr:LOW QUALITY PROTEIN: protein cueball [Pogonomyrmex barbatus]
MITAETRYLLPTLVLLCNLVVAYARSWDLAVVIGNEIDFFARNSTLMGHANIGEAVSLTGVAYDDTTRMMYLSDVRNNVSIFSNNLTEKNFTSTPLLKKENGMHVIGIVFDTSLHTLFWVDALKETIAKMHVSQHGEPGDPVILHNLTGNNPRGVALDVCNSRIYWTNSNTTNPSIECSNLDGSDRRIVIQENLYEPLAVAIDHAEQKLYWIDDVEGIHFKIERSNLDGSERELLVHNKHQQPVYLAVDKESMYWSDWVHSAIWTMPKKAKVGDYPIQFKSYYNSKRDADPAGIVTRDNVGQIDCATILSTIEKRTNLSAAVLRSAVETFNNLTTSTEESDLTTESSKYCLNNGHLNKTDNTCRCKEGFVGPFCEISLCHNYCLRGKCIINHHGFPECECADTFSGVRCERDICNGYCLFDGECSVQNGRPVCSCKYSKGTRCEEPNDIVEICAFYCASARTELPNVTSCRCTDSNQTAERITLTKSFQDGTLLSIFVGLTILFLIMVGVLSYYVNKLRRRPRIKRHYVVSKGITPLTSRPQIPDNQCEITIENCCNMNICETPCFEPKLRSGVPRSNSMKKEEKNSLLDNMEGNSC